VLLLLLLLVWVQAEVAGRTVMLLPGVRLVERSGVLHFFDGRRVVSVRGDKGGQRAIRQAIDDVDDAEAVRDAREMLIRLRLGTTDAQPELSGAVSLGAAFASAAVAGWVSPREAGERLRGTDVHVWDDAGDGLAGALASSGLRCSSLRGPDEIGSLDPGRSVVAVVAADRRPTQRLRETNAACIAHGVTWLPVGAYDGAVIHVGPLMIPGETACGDCLLLRLAANVEYADAYLDIADAPAAPTPPALREWSYAVAALNLLRWVANRDVRLPGKLYTLVPDEPEIRQATVYRVPRCASCAAPDFVTAAAPWDIARDH
jgi:bacteriocin biosynthesis cyclodehydratase domain-containing protein